MPEPLKILLTRSQQKDLSSFLAMGEDVLHGALDIVQSAWVDAMTPQDLAEGLLQGLKEATQPDAIVRLLISLRLSAMQSSVSIEDLVEGVWVGFQESPSPVVQAIRELPNSALKAYLSSPSVRRVSMAVNLSYEYPNLLRSSRLISDIRPIYNESATAIEAAVVSFTLAVNYSNEGEARVLSLALDEGDVKALIDQCERALKKAELARQAIPDVPSIVSGRNQLSSIS